METPLRDTDQVARCARFKHTIDGRGAGEGGERKGVGGREVRSADGGVAERRVAERRVAERRVAEM